MTDEIKLYYYRPLRRYSGTVWKCAGHGAEDPAHRSFYEPAFAANLYGDERFLPGVEIMPYVADRIRRDHQAQKWVPVFSNT